MKLTRALLPARRLLAALALFAVASAASAQDDPPTRVARLSYLSGDVTYAPAGENEWDEATPNRPLIRGDRVVTRRNSRAVLDLGGAELRVDSHSGFHLLELDEDSTQIELNSGTLNLRVDRLDDGERFEIDTPNLAFVVDRPGAFRIDAEPRGGPTTVTVFSGAGRVYGEGQASQHVDANQAYRFEDARLRQVKVLPLPRADEFDEWAFARDERFARSDSRRYVPDDLVGVQELDEYGYWEPVQEYGHVWYPRTVVTGWAPYRYGHWAWVAPWGWTWIDDAPWGFAPSHYGRWAYVHNRWGWVPGPRHLRAVYAPAVVAFFGGHGLSISIGFGAPVGWFPLSPYDVYVPSYHYSRHYFNRINVCNVTRIRGTVIDRYYDHARNNRHHEMRYAYRDKPHATTVVAQDTFVRSRPVRDGHIRVDERTLASASLTTTAPASPTRESLGRKPARNRGDFKPPSREFERTADRPRAPRGEGARTASRGERDKDPAPVARAEPAAAAPPANRDDDRSGARREKEPREAEARESRARTAELPSSGYAPREYPGESAGAQSRGNRADHPAYSPEPARGDKPRPERRDDAAREARSDATMPSSRYAPRQESERRKDEPRPAPIASEPARAYDRERSERSRAESDSRQSRQRERPEYQAQDQYQAPPQSRSQPQYSAAPTPQPSAPPPEYSAPRESQERKAPPQRSEPERRERQQAPERREGRSRRD